MLLITTITEPRFKQAENIVDRLHDVRMAKIECNIRKTRSCLAEIKRRIAERITFIYCIIVVVRRVCEENITKCCIFSKLADRVPGRGDPENFVRKRYGSKGRGG